MESFSLFTFFKNVQPTFFTFRNYYSSMWQVSEFVYFVGCSNASRRNLVKRHYIDKCGKKIRLNMWVVRLVLLLSLRVKDIETISAIDENSVLSVFVLYQPKESSNNLPSSFNKIKKFCNLIVKYLIAPFSSNKYWINVDDDEFLYSTDMAKMKLRIADDQTIRFHFIEKVCTNTLEDSLWSLQGWFSEKIINNEFNVSCDRCKVYNFNPKNKPFGKRGTFWIHSGSYPLHNSSCDHYYRRKLQGFTDNPLQGDICLHFTSFTFSQLEQLKNMHRFSIPGIEQARLGNSIIDRNSYFKVFDYFPTVQLSILNQYI